MVKLKIEDILFWIMVVATIGVILWKLNGSPTDMATMIAIGTFILASEVVVWKKIFSIETNFNSRLLKIDKNTSLGFIKVKHDTDKMRIEINNRFDGIDNRFNTIENKLDKLGKR